MVSRIRLTVYFLPTRPDILCISAGTFYILHVPNVVTKNCRVQDQSYILDNIIHPNRYVPPQMCIILTLSPIIYITYISWSEYRDTAILCQYHFLYRVQILYLTFSFYSLIYDILILFAFTVKLQLFRFSSYDTLTLTKYSAALHTILKNYILLRNKYEILIRASNEKVKN